MKLKKQNVLLLVLGLALAWSILLNWLQYMHVSRLMKEVDTMEQVQSALSTHLDELEQIEEAEMEADGASL